MMHGGLSIFSREPNRKNSFYIGNMNWWTTDLHVIATVKDHGLGDVVCLKFFENRANGQSKGYCLVEVASESLAQNAHDKLAIVEIHDRKLMIAHALRISPHQFESKCNQAKEQGTTPVFSSISSSSSPGQLLGSTGSSSLVKTNTVKTHTQTTLPGVIPPLPNPIFPQPPRPPTIPGFPTPPFAGLRPPGLPDFASMGLPGIFPPPFPPIPNASSINPFASRPGGLPTLPPIPPAALAALGSAGAAVGSDGTKLTAPHLNPAFLQDMSQSGANMAEMLAHAAARFRSQTAAFSSMSASGGRASPGDRGKSLPNHPSDEEISETNQRNKAISSSAITRAMSDAQAGDYESAIDTLRMAITLIKQSVTASSEASQVSLLTLYLLSYSPLTLSQHDNLLTLPQLYCSSLTFATAF
jgi:cleavage and polyadenylation specificity factor subunit 6/7